MLLLRAVNGVVFDDEVVVKGDALSPLGRGAIIVSDAVENGSGSHLPKRGPRRVGRRETNAAPRSFAMLEEEIGSRQVLVFPLANLQGHFFERFSVVQRELAATIGIDQLVGDTGYWIRTMTDKGEQQVSNRLDYLNIINKESLSINRLLDLGSNFSIEFAEPGMLHELPYRDSSFRIDLEKLSYELATLWRDAIRNNVAPSFDFPV